jgi:hypothetical protein
MNKKIIRVIIRPRSGFFLTLNPPYLFIKNTPDTIISIPNSLFSVKASLNNKKEKAAVITYPKLTMG